MRSKKFKAAALMIAVLTAIESLLPFVFTAAAEEKTQDPYTAELISKGFPEDYAEKLTALHKKHPSWTFEVLDVTGLSGGKYTWDYVITQEYSADEKRNLVSPSDTYLVYRDFSNFNLYDSGWYKASQFAVEYMMDPRNFLDEKQIFQFYSLSWSDTVTLKAVEIALKGTFMENAKLDGEYSDMTYAEYFMKIGKELGASPVYLAARVRNEQGTAGTSPLISGTCGDTLWGYYRDGVKTDSNGKLINAPSSGYTEEVLKKYNGLYNYFNIGASGTGYFQIYSGGMKEAMTGTSSMASTWGSASWNTRWKALYGGAKTATERYIGDYQNTSYLQKFNVDPRSSRNFWGQYMQSIHGSYSQAATFYSSFSSGGMLDLEWNFLIPVYSGMPESCPEPTGSEFTGRSTLTKLGGTADFIDISSLKSSGVKKSYTSAGIKWPVFVGKTGSYLDLGELDLSGYSDLLIEYSVSEKFDYFACGVKSVIGIVFDSDHIYGGEGVEADMSCDLGSYRMSDGATGGFLKKRVARISLTNVAHSGKVYLTAYTQPGQQYIVHNIVFVAKNGYTALEPVEYTLEPGTTAPAPEESTPEETGTGTAEPETTEPAGDAGGPVLLPAVIAVVAVVAVSAAAAVIIIIRKRNRPEK